MCGIALHPHGVGYRKKLIYVTAAMFITSIQFIVYQSIFYITSYQAVNIKQAARTD